jgi:ketosteroid isomerase-like protein
MVSMGRWSQVRVLPPAWRGEILRGVSQRTFEGLIAAFAEAWNRGDTETLRLLLHEDIRHTPPPGWPEPGPFVGRDAVMTHFDQLRETFHADSVEAADLTPVGERLVIRVVWRGSGLGPRSEVEFWQVSEMRDGRLIGMDQFWDRREALEAAGRSA